MPTGIFIPADDSVALTLREFSGRRDYQTAIGGYIEAVELSEPKFAASTLMINEEGKFLPEPPNKRATLLLWIHQPALRLRDEIVGDAILVGRANARGNCTVVPQRLRDVLFEAKVLTIEAVVRNNDGTKRVHRLGSFKTWVNAYVVAVDIAAVMPGETEIRIVPE